jgi:Flp pilus assembly protein TadG
MIDAPLSKPNFQETKAMQIRKFTPFLAVLTLALAPLSFGQLSGRAHTTHHTQSSSTANGEIAAVASTFAGTYTYRLTIMVKSVIPKNAVISCTGSLDVFDDTAITSFEEEASAVATLVSGTQYLCIVKIPYSWQLASGGTDMVDLGFSAGLDYGFQVTASNGASTFVQPVVARETTHSLPPIAVPLNGATTTNSITITM